MDTGPGQNQVKRTPVSNLAGVLQGTCARAAASGQDDVHHTLCGIELGSARIFIGERGANGGPEVWTGLYRADRQEIGPPNTEAFKLAIELNGRLRAWCSHGGVYDNTPGDAVRGNGWAYLQSDGNSSQNAGLGFYSDLVACADNALHFANCPPLGSVTVTIGAEAPIVVPLDAAGAAQLDMADRRFPLSVAFTIKDAGAAVVAALLIPATYGGDVIGQR